MRCARCGNENGEGNRFCGMCGAPLTPAAKQPPTAAMAGQSAGRNAAQEMRQERASANPPAATTSPANSSPVNTAPARAASSFGRQREEPTISGPSFLGLNQPGPARNVPRDDSRDPLRRSGNLDYLLEDDDYEEPKHGWGKVLFVLVALALAGGFGYLHWKQGGFNWLMVASSSKPAGTQTPADSAQAPGDNSGAATTSAAPNAASGTVPSGSNTPASGTSNTTAPPSVGAVPAGTAGTPSGAASPTPAVTPPGTAAAPSAAPGTEAPASSASGSDAPTPPGAAAAPANQTPSNSIEPAPAANGTVTPDAATQSSDEEQAPASPPAPPKAAPKPRAPKPAAAKPSDAVTEAKQYIYGRGVRQDCDRGVRMLKSAAGHADANAMIYLGVLYSQGTCAPRDLPTAYSWFAKGLNKEPNNQALQDDIQQIWSQMTQPERQLAIKLSQ